MHSLLIVGLVLLVRVIKVMELPVKHYAVGKILNYVCTQQFTVKLRVLTRLVLKHMQAFSDCL